MISVVVAVYNAEKCLGRCIDSILGQSYKDIEVILINDGSTDSSEKICNDYAAKDTRVKVITKENGGVSSSRNKGLVAATGEYVTFVDADDYLEKDFLQNAMEAFAKYHTDIIRMPYTRKIGSRREKQSLNIDYDTPIKKHDYIEKIYKKIGLGNTIDTACVNVFKKDVVSNLQFDERICYGEDTLFMVETLEKADNGICVVDKPSYIYVYSKNEGTNVFDSERWLKKLRDFRDVFLLKADKIITENHQESVRPYLIEKYRISVNGIVHLSVANKSLSQHKKFINDLVVMFEENTDMSPGKEYYAAIKSTCSVPKFYIMKMAYKGKRTLYNILTTLSKEERKYR